MSAVRVGEDQIPHLGDFFHSKNNGHVLQLTHVIIRGSFLRHRLLQWYITMPQNTTICVWWDKWSTPYCRSLIWDSLGVSKILSYFSSFVDQRLPNYSMSSYAGEIAVCNAVDFLFYSWDICDQSLKQLTVKWTQVQIIVLGLIFCLSKPDVTVAGSARSARLSLCLSVCAMCIATQSNLRDVTLRRFSRFGYV